jgi:hypothetical protein
MMKKLKKKKKGKKKNRKMGENDTSDDATFEHGVEKRGATLG